MTLTQHTRHQHTAQTPQARSRARDTVTGIAALLTLLVFVVGIPAILLTVAPVHGWPTTTWSGLVDSLTRPDDGHLFLAALAVLAWIAWIVFALSVAVEALSLLRGLPTPRLPVLGGPQRLAATLVAGAALLLSTPTLGTSSTTRPATAIALVDTAVVTPVTPTPAPVRPAPSLPHELPHPPAPGATAAAASHRTPQHPGTEHTVTVHRGDTLWSIAEHHLGSGSRFREIAQLNYGRPQHDGRSLTDAHWIYPGWILELPPTRHHSATTRTTAPQERATVTSTRHEQVREYRVRKGDTLWDIAADHLGDPERYREIFQLNRGRPQHNGGALTDPDEILVGWVLLLPPRHAAAADHHSSPSRPKPGIAPPALPALQRPVGDHHLARPEAGDNHLDATAAPAPEVTPTPVGPAAPDLRTSDTTTADTPAPSVDLSRLALGLTALAATGTLAELTRRRRRHQANRLPGHRIPLPDRETTVAETTLRASNAPITMATLQTALTRLTHQCRTNGVALPRIQAITMSSDAIDVLVAGDHEPEPVAPFARIATGRWALHAADLPVDATGATAHAYPALVSVGVIDDAVLLLNLEALGTVSLTGDPDAVRELARTLAVELATSPLSGSVALTLPDWLDDLAEIADPDRVCSTTPDAGARRAHARTAAVRRLLDDTGVDDLSDARGRDTAHDAWQPEMLITDTTMHAEPWSGVCIIRTGIPDHDGARIALTDNDGTAILTPLGLRFQPSRLTDTDYKQILTLLGPPDPQPPDVPTVKAERDDDAVPAPLRSAQREVLAALPIPAARIINQASTFDEERDAGSDRGVLLLGRPEIVGGSPTDTKRRARSLELIAYLALHPGASAAELDEALFPGRRVTHDMRNSLVSRTRTWLGSDEHGNLLLPLVTGSSGYHLAEGFRCDWTDFLDLARTGLATDTIDIDRLERALRLVRGRPFLGVDPAAYTWAEAATQEMISTIVDIAYELAVAHLDTGAAAAAIETASRALLVDPANEALHRVAITAASRRGDTEEALRLEQRLRTQLEDIDPDSVPSPTATDILREHASDIRH